MSVNEVRTELWTLKLPNKWQMEEGEDCVTLYHSDGVGALQLETFEKQGMVSEEDLKDLGHAALAQEGEVESLRVGDFEGITTDFVEDGNFWKFWYVAKGCVAIAATYNCDQDDSDKEKGVVLEILRSLRLVSQ